MSRFEGEIYLRPAPARLKVVESFKGERIVLENIIQIVPTIGVRQYTGRCLGAGLIVSGTNSAALILQLVSDAILVFPTTAIRGIRSRGDG